MTRTRIRCLATAALFAAGLAAPALAEDAAYGNLDFARMTKPQEDFFWKRLQSLAVEEAVLTYCGEGDDFAVKAKAGIRACVTAAALAKAEAYFHAQMKLADRGLHERKASCRGKPPANHGWLGVEIDEAPGGARVTAAVPDSPAASADLKAGDVIATIDGERVARPQSLTARIRALAPGATVDLTVTRDGAPRTVKVKLGAMAFDADGRAALDLPALTAASREDLQNVAGEVTRMCESCKTSVWAMFCR